MNFEAVTALSRELSEIVDLLEDGHPMTVLAPRDLEFQAGHDWSRMLYLHGHFLDREIRLAMQRHFEVVLVAWHQGEQAGAYSENFMMGMLLGLVVARYEIRQEQVDEPDMFVEEI